MKILVFLCGMICFQITCLSQIPLTDYLPPTPTAASLMKVLDAPVNLATGTPDISVPLYTIKAGSITLPISLSYHAGGHLVQDEASWVGLGWSLNVSGMVTRSIRGKEDDASYWNFFSNINSSVFNPGILDQYIKLVQLSKGITDPYPDLFSYNFNGNSGRFIYADSLRMMPVKPMRIEKILSANILTGFIITTQDGTKYTFTEAELSSTRSGASTPSKVTSFCLKTITALTGQTITLFYKPSYFTRSITLSRRNTYTRGSTIWEMNNSNTDSFTTTVQGQVLTKVTFPGGEIIFNSSNDRMDVNKPQNAVGDYKLNSIEVKDMEGRTVKTFKFRYGYFGQGSSDPNELRLKLTSLTETDAPNSISGVSQVHQFKYDESVNLPSRLSPKKDHWGYFNNYGVSELPGFDPVSGVVDETTKRTNPATTGANILTTVIYPTGGYTDYEYEPHDYSTGLPVYEEKLYTVNASDTDPAPPNSTPIPGEDPNYDLSGPFTITSQSSSIKLSAIIDRPYTPRPSDEAVIQLWKITNGTDVLQQIFYSENSWQVNLSLSPGTYYLKAISTVYPSTINAGISYQQPVPNSKENRKVGGVRVKRIVQHDGMDKANDIIRKYDYRIATDSMESSGVLLAYPKYTETSHSFACYSGPVNPINPGDICICPTVDHLTVNAESYVPLGSGNHITYKEVTVTLGENGERGKSFYQFTSDPNPAPQHSDVSWKRGLLLKSIDYDATGKKLKEVKNTYAVHSSRKKTVYGNLVRGYLHPCASETEINYYPTFFYQEPAVMISEWQYLAHSEQYTFIPDDESKFVKESSDYRYENYRHQQLTRESSLQSDGRSIVKKTLFPLDYPDGTAFIDNLKINHGLNYPIERVTYQELNGGNQVILGGDIMIYKVGGHGLLSEHRKLPAFQPINLVDYKFSNTSIGMIPLSAGPENFLPDLEYISQTVYEAYDVHKNPVQIRSDNNIATTLIWGLQGTHVIAVVTNANNGQVYYSGFEDTGSLNSDAKFGRKCTESGYVFSPPTGFSPTSDSELSYWYFENNAWKLQMQSYSGGTVVLNKGLLVDELRIYPKGSRMKTYSYNPLVGIHTMNDENNNATFYTYDPLNRLKLIMDHNKNILKRFDYSTVVPEPVN